ncbi:MAG: sensor histidine kinase [Noviherbaspirillum sp.]
MHELRNAVLTEWEKRVRETFEQAKRLRRPVIINTLPTFYDNLVEAITPRYPRESAVEGTDLAYAHGEERARLTDYDVETLILEYRIFRSVLFQVLEENRVSLNINEIVILNASIDEAVAEAVTAFSNVSSALREQFVAALTHDLRAPLGTASMAAELISHTATPANPARVKELAQTIVYNLTRMDQMLRELLDTMLFQRGEKLWLELSCFDILDVVNEVCQDAQIAGGLPCEVIGAPVKGWWNREALKRALENLLGNAAKYGARHKPVVIKVDEVQEQLVLSVHNEGLPIPAEEQETVFKVFRRASNARQYSSHGWGVGLPYVRAVAHSHGGTIVIDSAVERGTTFLISIPLDARPFQEPAAADQGATPMDPASRG